MTPRIHPLLEILAEVVLPHKDAIRAQIYAFRQAPVGRATAAAVATCMSAKHDGRSLGLADVLVVARAFEGL